MVTTSKTRIAQPVPTDRLPGEADLTELILQQRREIYRLQSEIAILRETIRLGAVTPRPEPNTVLDDGAETLRATLRAVWKKRDSGRR